MPDQPLENTFHFLCLSREMLGSASGHCKFWPFLLSPYRLKIKKNSIIYGMTDLTKLSTTRIGNLSLRRRPKKKKGKLHRKGVKNPGMLESGLKAGSNWFLTAHCWHHPPSKLHKIKSRRFHSCAGIQEMN
jgi:hypothetical protein